MIVGVILASIDILSARGRRRRDNELVEWLRPIHNATRHTDATQQTGTPYVIVRRDGAVWAGPWKNDGCSFTRVPKNWWIFRSREKAEQELESNDFLAGCTIEEAE